MILRSLSYDSGMSYRASGQLPQRFCQVAGFVTSADDVNVTAASGETSAGRAPGGEHESAEALAMAETKRTVERRSRPVIIKLDPPQLGQTARQPAKRA